MANSEYAVYVYKVDPRAEKGSILYWFPDGGTAMEVGVYPTRARAVRKAVNYKDRYWCGTQVVKLVYDDNGNEIDEQILESFNP